jgi:hypothetical protein
MMAAELYTDSISIEPYENVLLQLPDELKRKLINSLTSSLDEKEKTNTSKIDKLPKFHGSWGKGMSVEDYCKELRGNFKPREVGTW